MADTLHEVVGQLRPHRKFITPTVRNLDTGETYSVSEVPRKVPKPLSPRHLEPEADEEKSPWRARWAATRRLEVGTLVCTPFVPLIPASIKPNTITLFNHACNWFLLFLSCTAYTVEQPLQSRMLYAAAAVNFLCMMLDCLDGMHARRTGQTSKLGELLDHFLDAVHTPMVTGSAAVALRLPLWAVVGSCVLGVAVYNAQLIHFHYHRVFLETAGVEGQIGTSALMILMAQVSLLPAGHWAHFWVPQLIGISSVLVMSKLVLFYIVRFEQLEMSKFFLFMLLQVIPTYLHLAGYTGVFPFILVVSFVSFRISGSYVLNSIVTRPYSGVDEDVVYWLLAWLYSHLAMDQLPMRVFFSRLVPITGDFFLGYSVQDMLPYAMSIHFAAKNLVDVMRSLNRLLRMK